MMNDNTPANYSLLFDLYAKHLNDCTDETLRTQHAYFLGKSDALYSISRMIDSTKNSFDNMQVSEHVLINEVYNCLNGILDYVEHEKLSVSKHIVAVQEEQLKRQNTDK